MNAEPLTLNLVNGLPADQLPVTDRGLAYGDGLYETFLVSSGRLTLCELHLQRLQRGAARLHLELDLERIESELASVAAQLGYGVLKLTVTRGSGPRGYRLPSRPLPTRIIQTGPLPPGDSARQRDGIRLFLCKTRLAQQPLLAGVKHLNRLEQVLARAEWQDDFFAEGLVCDTNGNIVECTMSNLFLRVADEWVTPDLSDCGVQGVMRDHLIRTLASAGTVVKVRRVGLGELRDCSEAFCCNSVIGVWPVIGAGTHEWTIGSVTRAAQGLAMQALK